MKNTTKRSQTSDFSAISTKLRILLILHYLGTADAATLMNAYEKKYGTPLKKGSLHGTLSRLRVDGLIQSKVQVDVTPEGNERPLQVYKETKAGTLAVEKAVTDIKKTLLPIQATFHPSP